MKRIVLALSVVSMALGIAAGCVSQKPKQPPANQPLLTEAVLKSFTDICDESWSGVKVYISKSDYIPSDLKKVGMSPCTITDEQALRKEFEDLETAPAMAFIEAAEDVDGQVHVAVNYYSLRMKDHKPMVRDSTFEYIYKLIDGKLVMVSRVKSID